MRYVVTEIEGFLTHNGTDRIASHAVPGLSVMVVDTLVNRRVVGMWRSEDYANRGYGARTTARQRARDYADALNADQPRARSYRVAPPHRFGFRPTCPRCATVCPARSVRCTECGARLLFTESDWKADEDAARIQD